MSLAQLKNVKWSDDERVDLDDLRAMSDLKDADVRELLLGFMEPPANGRVYRGFTGAAGVGLFFDFDAVDGLAVASDGSMLETIAAAPLSVALPASATVYIHAYLVEQDSDLDNRRFLNDIPVPPEEYTLNTPTRQTKAVGLYVTNNTDVTPLLSSFATSAFISGKTRQLVALYALKTNGVGVIGGSIVDFKHSWLPGGNQIPAINGGVAEFPTGTPTVANTLGLRSMFRMLAGHFRAQNSRSDDSWWDSTLLLTDPLNNSVSPDLRSRINSAKQAFATVHPTAGRGDYTTFTAALAATSSGEIRFKKGTHLVPVATALTGKQNITFSGEGQENTILKGNDGTFSSNPMFTLGANTKKLTFKDMTIQTVNDGSSPSGPLFDFTATTVEDITFINCRLSSAIYAHFKGIAATAKHLKLINCFIDLDIDGLFDVSVAPGWNPSTPTVFTNCYINPLGSFGVGIASPFSQNGGITGLVFNGCQFGDPTLGFTWAGFTDAMQYQNGSNLTWQAHFNDCDFWGLESFIQATNQVQQFRVEFIFTKCRFKAATTSAATPLFNYTATSISFSSLARVQWDDCVVEHFQIMSATFAGCNFPCLYGSNTRFQTLASSSSAHLFYITSGFTTAWTCRFTNCQFYHRTAYAFHYHIDTTGSSGGATQTVFFFKDCLFTSQASPGTQALSNVATQIRFIQDGTGTGTVADVHMVDCHFISGSANLPMEFIFGSTVGFAGGMWQYTWLNNTDGTATDTGISFIGATWRSSETKLRLRATARFSAL